MVNHRFLGGLNNISVCPRMLLSSILNVECEPHDWTVFCKAIAHRVASARIHIRTFSIKPMKLAPNLNATIDLEYQLLVNIWLWDLKHHSEKILGLHSPTEFRARAASRQPPKTGWISLSQLPGEMVLSQNLICYWIVWWRFHKVTGVSPDHPVMDDHWWPWLSIETSIVTLGSPIFRDPT